MEDRWKRWKRWNEMSRSSKYLECTITNGLSVSPHIHNIIASSAQALYALRVLRAHGLMTVHYKLSTEQSSSLSPKIQAFISRSKNVGFCNTELDDFALLCAKADRDLFTKVLNSPDHVLHPFLPPPVQQNYNLRNRPHNRQLPERSSRLVYCNFIIRMLYHNMY